MNWAEETTVKFRRKCQWCGKKKNGKLIALESWLGYDADTYYKMYFCCKECAKKYVQANLEEQSKDRELRKYIFGGEE